MSLNGSITGQTLILGRESNSLLNEINLLPRGAKRNSLNDLGVIWYWDICWDSHPTIHMGQLTSLWYK